MVFMGADDRRSSPLRSGPSCANSRRCLARTGETLGPLDALPADGAAVDAARGARHVHHRHPARRRRCAARHVCDARRRHRRRDLRPDLHLRLRPRPRRCRDLHRALAPRHARRSASMARTCVHRLIRLPDWERLAAAFRPFFAIGLPAVLTQIATPVGNAYRHHRDCRLRRRCGGRLGDRRAYRAGRFRRHLCALRRRRADPRPEFRRAQIRSADVDDARRLLVTIVYVLVVWALLAHLRRPDRLAVRRQWRWRAS